MHVCSSESLAGCTRWLPALYDSMSAKAESMDNLEALPSGADVRCNVATGGTKARSVVLLRVSSGSPLPAWVSSFPERVKQSLARVFQSSGRSFHCTCSEILRLDGVWPLSLYCKPCHSWHHIDRGPLTPMNLLSPTATPQRLLEDL